MPDFDPKDMDALFREGAERHEFEYNPNSWALMEEKLDKKQNERKILFYLLGLVLLIGFVAIYSYSHFNSNSSNEIIASSNIEDDRSESAEINVVENVELADEITIVENNEVETPSVDTQESTIHKKIKKESITTDSKVSCSNIGAQNSFQSENTGNLVGNEIVSIDSQTESPQGELLTTNTIATTNYTESISKIDLTVKESQSTKDQISISTLKNIDLMLFDSDLRDLESYKLTPTQTQIIPTALATSNRLALTVFANPEWSSVGLFQDSRAGWSVGTKFGYQFADKFEVSAGLAFSRKIYKGAGKEYNMEGGWIYDIVPMQMDAKCDVIEIPVSLSYYTNGFRNNSFFVDLGINSYMLHSEWYGFDYDDALVRPERYKEVIEEDENTHLVGVGRFAIGYQKVLSNHTSLQVAPYLQFPLTGIGAGKVNLYSSGVQIAVKFNTQ